MFTNQHQRSAPPVTFIDRAGFPHSLDLNASTGPAIDGQAVASLLCQPEVITFYLQQPGPSSVTFSPTALWEAFVGPGSTLSTQEAGYLLAQALASRLAVQHLSQQFSQYIDSNPLILPPYREQFAPFIEGFLERCAGSTEDLEAIARVGSIPMEQLLRWVTQHGKDWPLTECTVSEPLQDEDENRRKREDTLLPEAAGTSESQGVSMGPKEYFHWSEERIQTLTSAFLQSTASNIHAACCDIADQFGWPVKKVEYKVYYLKLPELKLQQTTQALVEMSPAQEPAKITVPSAVMPEMIISPETADLVSNPPSSEADAAAELKIGSHLWTVKVDGGAALQQWRLEYPYGSFPEQPFQGKKILYQGAPYRIDRISTSQIHVYPLSPTG